MSIPPPEELYQRLDPRVRAFLQDQPEASVANVASRAELLADATSPEGLRRTADEAAFMDGGDTEEVAPSTGLRISSRDVVSLPDGNTIRLQIIRPDDDTTRPCVYYIHGGAMLGLSCYLGNYRAWGRLIASFGVVVVMVDFRNAVSPSSVPDVAPYPAGLDDCVSGLRWVHSNAESLGVDPSRIVVAGESGGGNLAIATGLRLKRDGDLGLVKGLFALCPFILGSWPDPRYPSSSEYFEFLTDVRGNRAMVGYGVEAYQARDPMAWAGFASREDVAGLPTTVISVNECDPLRDEGIALYRLLLSAGVEARGRVVLGTMHATEVFPAICPEVSRDTAREVAVFASG